MTVDDDRALWKQFTKYTIPHHSSQIALHLHHKSDEKKVVLHQQPSLPNMPTKFLKGPHHPHKDLRMNDLANMDHRKQKKLKKGVLPIDNRLDLHGLNAAQAKSKIDSFIKENYDQQKKCLLVITGKGKGVLKRELPFWLNQAHLKPYIISFSESARHHGGTGAFYITLRKKHLKTHNIPM